jgi:phosphoenolpyruvate carboxylase
VAPLHQDLVQALERHYRYTGEVPVFLRYRSWIGGDRDGNHNVTAAVTRDTIRRHRRTALELHLAELRELREELSISDRAAPTTAALLAELRRLEGGRASAPGEHAHEPYRRLLADVIARLELLLDATTRERGEGEAKANAAGEQSPRREASRPGRQLADCGEASHAAVPGSAADYDAESYIRHLELMRDSLAATGFEVVARTGRIARMLTLARTFGFHLAALDVRQHSRVHEQAVAALLAATGIHADYLALAEPERLRLLEQLLQREEQLVPEGMTVPAEAAPVLDAFAEIRRAQKRDPRAIGSYVISMTHRVSDVLEPMLLARAAGLLQPRAGAVTSTLDFVPLFETIDDLAGAAERMTAIWRARSAASSRRSASEIMLVLGRQQDNATG